MDGITDVYEEDEVEETHIEEGEGTDTGDGDDVVVEETTYFSESDVTQFAETVGLDVALFTGKYSTLSDLNNIVVAERARKTAKQKGSVAPQVLIEEVDADKVIDTVAQEDAFAEALTTINTRYGG